MNSVGAWPKESCSYPGNWHPIVTCEHAGKRIPGPYRYLFEGKTSLVQSHRGFDTGAFTIAGKLAGTLGASFYPSVYTRLLIDLNRSLTSRSLFSTVTASLSKSEKEKIIDRYYAPFRNTVYQHLAHVIGDNDYVLHFSVHTFTPVFKGSVRQCDVGILYDPDRQPEKRLACFLAKSFGCHLPDMRIRYNYPYRGTADGHVTFLRKHLPADRYLGIELEINQKYPLAASGIWQKVQKHMVESIQEAVNGWIHSKGKPDGR